MSGIGSDEPSRSVWYRRTFDITPKQLDGAVLLRFGAVDHRARVWVNGKFVGEHEGGFTPFVFEIARFLHTGSNELVVKAEDGYDREIPRGKQMWERMPQQCFYTSMTP